MKIKFSQMKAFFGGLFAICLVGSFFLMVSSALAVSPINNVTKDAGSGANVNGSGTIAWTNTNNIVADDSSYATADLSPDATSEYLYAKNYGFSIPAGATINGIEVSIMRQSSENFTSNSINDVELKLLKDGTMIGSNKAKSTDWPTSMG